MDEETIVEIKKLNEEILNIVNKHSKKDRKIIFDDDFVFDQSKHDLSEELIKNALLNGLHLEDRHLYPVNPNKKHKGKNYYCIYKYKKFILSINYLLISYSKKYEKLILFHLSPLNYKSEEQRKYEEIQKSLKDLSSKKT